MSSPPPPSSQSPSSQSPPSLPPIVMPPAAASTQQSPVPQRDRNAVLHNRPLILALLFGVLAVLGLPMLWYSPVFSRKEKFWWSIAVVVYTLALVLMAAAAWMLAYNAVMQGQLSL